MSSFSNLYAQVKAGESTVARPYVKPVAPAEFAVYKRCADVTKALDSTEAHEGECSRLIENVQKSSLFLFTAEVPCSELGNHLSREGRALFAHGVVTTNGRHEQPRFISVRRNRRILGWQRYSVAFGTGRMGLEFEYNAREIQRLVITNASKHPLALGIRPRDILIGIGDQTVPRATNPLAVHQHLVACVRPVILHFYRPHERQKEVNARSVESLRCDSLVRGQKNVLTVGASALWGRFLAPTQTNKSSFASVPRALLSTTKLVSGFVQRRLPSEFAIPAVRMNSVRYGTDDDGTPINAEKRCILNEGTRLALIRALKPLLRPKPWELVYDSACDGMCLGALYAHAGAAKSSQAQLILCRDNLGHIGGAFLDEPIRNAGDYFGTGECFVFAVAGRSGPGVPEAGISCDPDISIYRWVGLASSVPSALAISPGLPPIPHVVNDMFVYATHEVLGFGSGGGGFALRLDEALEFGASRPCATYNNPVSLFGGRENFPVERIQIWTFATQFL